MNKFLVIAAMALATATGTHGVDNPAVPLSQNSFGVLSAKDLVRNKAVEKESTKTLLTSMATPTDAKESKSESKAEAKESKAEHKSEEREAKSQSKNAKKESESKTAIKSNSTRNSTTSGHKSPSTAAASSASSSSTKHEKNSATLSGISSGVIIAALAALF